MAKGDKKTTQNVNVGRKVSFVGGPLAGDVRIIPDSVGEFIKAADDSDYHYRMFPLQFSHNTQAFWFAYDAQKDPSGFLVEMWDEYCPSAKVKRGLQITQFGKDRFGR